MSEVCEIHKDLPLETSEHGLIIEELSFDRSIGAFGEVTARIGKHSYLRGQLMPDDQIKWIRIEDAKIEMYNNGYEDGYKAGIKAAKKQMEKTFEYIENKPLPKPKKGD